MTILGRFDPPAADQNALSQNAQSRSQMTFYEFIKIHFYYLHLFRLIFFKSIYSTVPRSLIKEVIIQLVKLIRREPNRPDQNPSTSKPGITPETIISKTAIYSHRIGLNSSPFSLRFNPSTKYIKKQQLLMTSDRYFLAFSGFSSSCKCLAK